MNRHVYKSFLQYFPVILVLVLAGIDSYARQTSLVLSRASECAYRLSFTEDLADLAPHQTPDSQVVFQQTHFVAIPIGATARLVAAEGSDLIAIAPATRSKITAFLAGRPLVELGQPITVRGHRLVPVIVSPLVGNAVYQTVDVSVAFAGGMVSGPAAPADPFFERVVGPYVVNEAISRSWPVLIGNSVRAAQDGPFSSGSNWYKVEVAQTGLHRITGAELQAAGISLNNLASSSVRMLNGGGVPLPQIATTAGPFLQEISLRIEDGGDGFVGASDRIYFYGEGVDRWTVDESGTQLFVNNVYTDRNVYWLTVDDNLPGAAARMSSITAAPVNTPDTTITTFTRRIRSEQDKLLLEETGGHIDSYYQWYWSDQTNLSFSVPTIGYVSGDTATIVAYTYTDTGDSQTTLFLNGLSIPSYTCNAFNCGFKTTSLTGGLDMFAFDMQRNPLADVPYFDYMELSYTSRLLPVADKLDLILASINALAEIEVQDNFSTEPWVLDIADPFHPVILTGAVRGGTTLRFQTDLESPGRNRFLLSTPAVAYAPVAIRSEAVTDLYGQTQQADMILVTPRVFSDDLDEYIDYRTAQGATIKVVTVEDIMDNFGFGLTDPGAIRDYLKFAYETFAAPAPSGVLFVGDANYDYLDRLATGQPNFVPSYIHSLPSSFDLTYSDDNYVYFGDYGILDADTSWDSSAVSYDRGFDMMAARWPVKSVSEINSIVDKIKRYDAESSFGPWRNRITYVADDEFNPDREGFLEQFHVTQAETLSVWHTPNHFDKQKIYLWDFAKANNVKPECNDAIVSAINAGTLLINYVGHGNPDVWAHERVFTRQSDLPRLSNRTELPLFVAASCAIGFFDDPMREGMAEDLLAMSGGGAIGVVSATRLVYSFDNAQFNQQVFDVLLDNEDLSICESVYLAKLLKQYGNRTFPRRQDNDRAYAFFGDPFTRLAEPRYRIAFSEAPDSLAALARSQVRGRVVDRQGQPVLSAGSVTISVYDSDRLRNYLLDNGSDTVSYAVTGASMYRGSASVTNGEFAFEFVTPLDIGIGGAGARISVYGIVDTIDAIGLVDSLPVSSVVTPTTDSVGPSITVAVAGRGNLGNGDLVTRQDELVVTLADSSGINLATGLGHGITLEIDGETQSIRSVTELFSYQQDEFTTGSLALAASELEPGQHTLKFKAWDNANNSSTVSLSIEVATGASLAIQDLLNYPNPMADSTTFFFELTQAVSRFDLDIFTLSGRKIKSFRRLGIPVGSHQIVWNGRDADGDRVATGVYIFKASAQSASGGDAVESFGKVVVVN
jgi:hypothetical protein